MQAQQTARNTQRSHVQRASQSAMRARRILNMSATRNAVSGRGDSGGERCARACMCVCAESRVQVGDLWSIASKESGSTGACRARLISCIRRSHLGDANLGLFPLTRCKSFPLGYFDYGARLLQVPKDVQQQHDAGAQHGACCEQHCHVRRDHYTLRRPVAEASLVLVQMWHGVSPILVQIGMG